MYLPEDVKKIIDTLYAHGHEAYAVGGCVRDMILGRKPEDWDITTSAMPEETKALFERTFDTGIEHGTITVLLHGVGYEVTTYRIDGKYEDSRHPSEVEFTRNLKEDLLRRDFTINAMAYNDKEGLVDIFGGIVDIEQKVVRCVGNAEARFGEDALRILRAIRFSAQLGFVIEEETRQGIRNLAKTLENISVERIQVEMVKLLISKHPEYVEKAYELGVTAVILPEWDENRNACAHALEVMKRVEANKMLRLAAMLQGVVDADRGRAILKRWKFDNSTIKTVYKLIQYYDYQLEPESYQIRCAMHEMGLELFPQYLALKYADEIAKGGQKSELKLQKIKAVETGYHQILERGECTTLRQLAVTGSDLLANGVNQGKEIGEVLQELLGVVLENPEYNTKAYLLEYVNTMRKGIQ